MDFCKPALPSTRPVPTPAGKPRSHYRRSTTTKAPRKRTFIMNMTKYSPGVRSEGAGGGLCKANAAANPELLQSSCGGGEGGRPHNGGRSFGSSGGDGDAGRGPQPLPRTLMVGAIALIGALVLLPSQASASSDAISRRVAAVPSSPRGPRQNLCLNNSTTPAGTAIPEDAIVYGQVQLSAAERRLMAGRQLFFRETLRSEALCN